MALISLGLMADASASLNVQFERKSKQVALAYFDIADDEVFVLKNCTLTIGGRHPSDFGQILTDIDVDLEAANVAQAGNLCNLWRIAANYGPWNPATQGDPAQAANPLAAPPRVRIEWELHPEPIWSDINGDPIVNTAGDPFDPPVELDNLIAIITVERNEPTTLDIPSVMALSGNVNQSAWNGYDAKCVRVAPIGLPNLEYSQEANIYFWTMVYVFQVNFKTWARQPLNCGYRQRSPTQINQKRVLPILDDSGQPLQSPGLLDGNGLYLKPPVAQNAVLTGAFDVHQPTDFGVFNLDNLFTPPSVLS